MRYPRTALALSALLLTVGCSGPATDQSSTSSDTSPETANTSATASATATPTPEEPAELPGGGTEIFDNKRYVALYGNPSGPTLGALGEQTPEESVDRIKELMAQYQEHSTETVIPAFEVITTVASAASGPDGDYSDEPTIDTLLPIIETAAENDVYVVLDFQPGRSDFLSQIKQYEELLKFPHVGVGFDPEWRLEPWQVHLQQIGSVHASEINESLDYLAQLTAENNLPQKMIILHQFTHSMIVDRESIRVDHPELALTLHADGHGTPELKDSTYQELIRELNPDIKPSWKNFYDEDTPMLTPAQTYQLDPKPWVVTYQ